MLRMVADQRLPVDVSDPDDVDELLVLMSAGLVAALRVRRAVETHTREALIVRVLAITPDGRRLLRRSAALAEASRSQAMGEG